MHRCQWCIHALFPIKPAQFLNHYIRAFAITSAGRFIGQQPFRVHGQCPRRHKIMANQLGFPGLGQGQTWPYAGFAEQFPQTTC